MPTTENYIIPYQYTQATTATNGYILNRATGAPGFFLMKEEGIGDGRERMGKNRQRKTPVTTGPDSHACDIAEWQN
jgi:hypothetical protein